MTGMSLWHVTGSETTHVWQVLYIYSSNRWMCTFCHQECMDSSYAGRILHRHFRSSWKRSNRHFPHKSRLPGRNNLMPNQEVMDRDKLYHLGNLCWWLDCICNILVYGNRNFNVANYIKNTTSNNPGLSGTIGQSAWSWILISTDRCIQILLGGCMPRLHRMESPTHRYTRTGCRSNDRRHIRSH
jgi:hypothetical protein